MSWVAPPEGADRLPWTIEIGPPVLAGPDSAAAGAIRRELVLTSADQVCVSGLVLAPGYQLTGATIGPVSRDEEDVWLCYGICRPDVTRLEWRVGDRSALGRPVPIMGDDEVRVFALLLPDLGQSFVSYLRVVDAQDAERQTLELLVDSPNTDVHSPTGWIAVRDSSPGYPLDDKWSLHARVGDDRIYFSVFATYDDENSGGGGAGGDVLVDGHAIRAALIPGPERGPHFIVGQTGSAIQEVRLGPQGGPLGKTRLVEVPGTANHVFIARPAVWTDRWEAEGFSAAGDVIARWSKG